MTIDRVPQEDFLAPLRIVDAPPKAANVALPKRGAYALGFIEILTGVICLFWHGPPAEAFGR